MKRPYCYGCARCCGGMHKLFVEGTIAGSLLMGLLALACLGLFSYSAYLLDPHPMIGSGCDASTACVSGSSGGGSCYGFASQTAGMSCDNVCASAQLAGVVPFKFTVSPPPAGVSDKDRWISCPFPKHNTDWRIPTYFFAFIVLAAAVAGYCLRWRRMNIVLGLLLITGGGISFYLTIIDGDAVNKGTLACQASFTGVTRAYTGTPWFGVTCDMVPFAAVAILDGLLTPLLVSSLFIAS